MTQEVACSRFCSIGGDSWMVAIDVQLLQFSSSLLQKWHAVLVLLLLSRTAAIGCSSVAGRSWMSECSSGSDEIWATISPLGIVIG